MPASIQVSNLTKYYGQAKTPAIDKISFAVKEGEVYGLLGANGAGKTTTIRTIMDFIRPNSGTVTLLGERNHAADASLRRHVGYLPGDVILPKGVTARTLLDYFEQLSGMTNTQYKTELIRRFEAQLDKKTNALSKGNRQKIGIVQAFMHQPSILILDEPTSGLDPLMQEQFYKTVEEARERGAAVLLSSHSFEEIERMCDRIGIVRNGKLVHEGLIGDIMAARLPRWRVMFRHEADAAKLKKSPDLVIISEKGSSLTVEPKNTINQALLALSRYPIVSMTSSQRELEDEFLRFYKGNAGTQA